MMPKLTYRSSLALFLVFALVIFFSVNIIAGGLFRSARMDLTADHLYTLSEGTREVLKALPDTITLTFYFSDKLADQFPATQAYGERVKDMLKEYRSLSGGRIDLNIIDPEPFSEEEDQAVAQGLTGVPTGNGDQLYFGLVGVDTTDRKEIIPIFDQRRERFLEYDLTQLVQNLKESHKPLVGVLSSLPLAFGPGGLQAAMQGRSQPFSVWQQLNETFNVTTVAEDFDMLPEGLDVLVLAHPAMLTPHQLFAIDQFVLHGGRALVMLDPYAESAAYMAGGVGNAPVPQSSSLEPLLAAWGVTFDTSEVVADRALAQQVATGDARNAITDYVIWLRPQKANMSPDDLVTANLNSMLIAAGGYFTQADGATTSFEPLITSTDEATIVPSTSLAMQPTPDMLLRDYRPSGSHYVMAARVTGPAKTAFPDGPPQLESDATTSKDIVEKQNLPSDSLLTEAEKPINVILIADSDFLDDRFWIQTQNVLGQRIGIPTADNGAFVLNAVENLTGSDALISLRSRGTSERPFTVVDELRREAEQQYLAEEQRLQQRLDQTEKKIADMEGQQAQGGLFLSPEQQDAIAGFREQALETRKQLREVQRRLRSDIEALAMSLRILNILVMPLIVAAVAVALGIMRQRRYRRSRRPA